MKLYRNTRVTVNGRKGTVAVPSRDRDVTAWVTFDDEGGFKAPFRLVPKDLIKVVENDVPTDPRKFWLGYLDGANAYWDQHINTINKDGSSYSIGWFKGYEDAKAGRYKFNSDEAYVECGGKL